MEKGKKYYGLTQEEFIEKLVAQCPPYDPSKKVPEYIENYIEGLKKLRK